MHDSATRASQSRNLQAADYYDDSEENYESDDEAMFDLTDWLDHLDFQVDFDFESEDVMDTWFEESLAKG